MKKNNKYLKVFFMIFIYVGITFYTGFRLFPLLITLWAIYSILSDSIDKKNKEFAKDGTIPISSKVPSMFRK